MTTSSVNTSSTGPTIQFSGLSGLDTASIISSLMQVESQPQTNLKNTVAGEQAQVTALQTLNSALASLVTSSDGFRTGSTWTQMAAKSSNSAVTVAANGGATPTNLSVSVIQSASAAEVDFTAKASSRDAVIVPPDADPTKNVLDISLPDGSTQQVSTGDGKLSTIVANLSALKGTDGKPLLNASAVAVGGGSYSLIVTSAATGAGSLAITDPQGNSFFAPAATVSSAGRDAQISIGAGMTLTSSTNTFTNVVNGVDITVAAGYTSDATTKNPVVSQVSVADDGSSRATAVNAFVSQINSVLTSISSATAYGTSSGTGAAPTGGGILPGNPELRDVASKLVAAIISPDRGVSLGNMGLSVDRDGALTFDSAAFTAAYQADPQGVTAAFTGSSSFVSRIQDAANAASAPASGTISTVISSMNSQISQQNDEIADWDDRLAQTQAHLQQVYTNLETVLATMQSQQSWLSSALSGLDNGWTQNS